MKEANGHLRIEVIEGPMDGAFCFGVDEALIGRSESADLPLVGDASVSSQHAMFEYRAGRGCRITDLESTNGSWRHGSRLTKPVMLESGAVVAVGFAVLRVVFEEKPCRKVISVGSGQRIESSWTRFDARLAAVYGAMRMHALGQRRGYVNDRDLLAALAASEPRLAELLGGSAGVHRMATRGALKLALGVDHDWVLDHLEKLWSANLKADHTYLDLTPRVTKLLGAAVSRADARTKDGARVELSDLLAAIVDEPDRLKPMLDHLDCQVASLGEQVWTARISRASAITGTHALVDFGRLHVPEDSRSAEILLEAESQWLRRVDIEPRQRQDELAEWLRARLSDESPKQRRLVLEDLKGLLEGSQREIEEREQAASIDRREIGRMLEDRGQNP